MSANSRLSADEAAQLLAEFFGGSFRVHASATPGDSAASQAESPGARSHHVPSAVELLSSDAVRMTIHLGAIVGSDTFAVGDLRRTGAEMRNALPSMAIKYLAAQAKIRELNCFLDSCSRYVSQHLEELTWLRSLAQHVALCRDEQELEQAAGHLLPALLGLVGAKQILLVRNSAEDDGATGCTMVRRCGEPCMTDANCVLLIERLLAECGDGVIVKNNLSQTAAFADLAYRGSCILVPIVTAHALVGWLLALGKDEVASPTMPRLSEQEFGTVEASLLAAAAQILAAAQRDRAPLAVR